MKIKQRSDDLDDLNRQLGTWLSKQSLLTQMRFHCAGGRFFQAIKLVLWKLCFIIPLICLLLITFYWRQHTKQHQTLGFRENLTQQMAYHLGAEAVKVFSVKKSEGKISLGLVKAIGKEDTFFSEIEMSLVKFKWTFLDFIQKNEYPKEIEIAKLQIALQSGTDTAESAEGIKRVFFQENAGTSLLEKIQINNASLQWGLSNRTMGNISESQLSAQRLSPYQWRLIFRGGTFSQNWLKDLKIQELHALVSPEEIVFEKGIFGETSSELIFQNVKIVAGSSPKVEGNIQIKHLPVNHLIPSTLQKYLLGHVSGNFLVTGSTNTSEGIGFEGTIQLLEKDQLVITDKFPLVQAFSILDSIENYEEIPFHRGSFKIKTYNESVEIEEIQLDSPYSIGIRGALKAMKPKDEKPKETAKKDGSNKNLNLLSLNLDSNIKLEKDSKSSSAFKSPDELKELSSHWINTHKFKGSVQFRLPKSVFLKRPKLMDAYQERDENERILVDVPLSGYFKNLMNSQIEEIYKKSKR